MTGFQLSRIIGKPVLTARPFALSVEPSGHCQLKCPECPTGMAVLKREKGTMTIDDFNKIISETASYIIYLNLYFQGEPLLHPQIATMVNTASQKGIFTNISTNGLLLTENLCRSLVNSGLSRIVISMDGLSQEVYEKYRRGGNVETVKQGILNLIKVRQETGHKNPLIVVQFLAFRHNLHETKAVKQWCQEVGVDKTEIKTAQVNDFGDGSVVPSEKKSRYKFLKNGSLKLKGRPHNHCWRQWSSVVVAWNGQTAPCCYDKDIQFPLGNISSNTLNEIWENSEMKLFRQQIIKNRSEIDMCKNCPEGRNFWY